MVAPTPVPFLIGGAEKFLWGLQSAINQLTPHDAELIKVPCRDQEFWPLMAAYKKFYQLDLNYFDRVISTKYPAWMLSHPAHDVYMQHTCRGVYDLYPRSGKSLAAPRHNALKTLYTLLGSTSTDEHLIENLFEELFTLKDKPDLPQKTFEFPGPLTRAVIHFLDRYALSGKNIQRYFAISENVINRDGYFPAHANVQAIHHPTDLRGLYCRSYDYIFTASRLEELKRLDLLIKAFKKVRTDISFKIAGTGGQENRLKTLAADDPRIEFLGYVSDDELIECYARALFVPFIPFDEDYGLITLEAMLSGKAVLTTHDAGGVTELIKNGKNGAITSPEPKALAKAMDQLIKNRDRTIAMGKAARKSARHVTWGHTVKQLFRHTTIEQQVNASTITLRASRKHQKNIVMVNDYAVHPPVSGGRKRIYHLCAHIASIAEIKLVTMGNDNDTVFQKILVEGATEICAPKTRPHIKAEKALANTIDRAVSVNDIAAIEGYKLTPDYCKELEKAVAHADLVICAHPYLYRAVRTVWQGPIWLDAHNVEADMKESVLPPTLKGRELLDQVVAVERQCVKDAELISCVSKADQERLDELYGPLPPTVMVPNGMDFTAIPMINESYRKALKEGLGVSLPIAVFVGSNHAPNTLALNHLIEIAPECRHVAFFIVGSVCEPFKNKPIPRNMRLLGPLSEAEKEIVLGAADLGLNPVSQGGGSNLKIIEYIAYKIPVLTTPWGVRGFEFENGVHLWVRELDNFSEAVRQMASDEYQREMAEMAERAYLYAESLYDWIAASGPLLEYIANGSATNN